MANLIYTAITSLDGYVADADGKFDWAAPDEEVHAFVNDLQRGIGTHLYGRRMYEVMAYWETAHLRDDQTAVEQDYTRIWQTATKIIYSSTLESVSSARTTIQRTFDPEAVRQLKENADHDLTVGGPGLATSAIGAGLVDEWHQFINPVIVGGGTSFLPDDVRVDLELLDEHRFASGVVHLHYKTRR
jgi:dihydrofolate reductase